MNETRTETQSDVRAEVYRLDEDGCESFREEGRWGSTKEIGYRYRSSRLYAPTPRIMITLPGGNDSFGAPYKWDVRILNPEQDAEKISLLETAISQGKDYLNRDTTISKTSMTLGEFNLLTKTIQEHLASERALRVFVEERVRKL
jgi:hypothetical protein